MNKILLLSLAFVSICAADSLQSPYFGNTAINYKKNPFLPKNDPNLKITVRRKYFACDFSTQKFALESYTVDLDTSLVLVKHLYPLPEFRLGVKF